MKISILLSILSFLLGYVGGTHLNKLRDMQLIDHALYQCSKQNKVEVSLRENKEGECDFFVIGAE